jgi:hypothetical protein
MQTRGFFILIILLWIALPVCQGEGRFRKWLRSKPDSLYVQNKQRDLVVRFYASQKYAAQSIHDKSEKIRLNYFPSNGYVVGLGFNYKFLGVNIGTVFPFARNDVNKYGKTKKLDFQSHLYLRMLTVDFYTGYYKGFYLNNTENILYGHPSANQFYTRGDIEAHSGGLGLYANLNPTKYSVRAPFLQNEMQMKSAGQPILGMEIYWVGSSADSSFIPTRLKTKNFFDGINFNKWRFFSMNITSGYAYTLVVQKRFFIMAGVSGSIGLGEYILNPIDGGQLSLFSANYSLNERFGLGYHYNRLYIGMSLTNFQYFTPTAVQKTSILWSSGNLRFNIAYRFRLKKEIEIRPWKWF